jgi:hypothetical protein
MLTCQLQLLRKLELTLVDPIKTWKLLRSLHGE